VGDNLGRDRKEGKIKNRGADSEQTGAKKKREKQKLTIKT
jgi:hypothetical protein